MTNPASKPSSSAKPAKQHLAKLGSALPWLLIACGVVGLFASVMLTYDQVQIWRNPTYQPSCDLNPLISCGSVITSGQGELFHIPGPFFGLAAFPVIITIGAAMLAGARFKRWFWQGIQVGTVLGVLFALWMFWESLFRIHALCPFCLTVDVAMYTLFWYVTLHNLNEEHIKTPSWLARSVRFCRRHHLDILLIWFVALAAYTIYHFWYYFGAHL